MIYRYRDYRNDNGDLSAFYWELLALRFTFVIIFEVLLHILDYLM